MFQVSTQSTPPINASLIIHHLSDIHMGRVTGSRSAIEDYLQYLSDLPNDKRPHLLIITGDLTLLGSAIELREAALAIRNIMQRSADGSDRQRLFIVPGPHDIDWKASALTDSFASFREQFFDCYLPTFFNRENQPINSADPYVQSLADHYLVYVTNTCFIPEQFPKPTPRHLDDLTKLYRNLWREQTRDISTEGFYREDVRADFMGKTHQLLQRDTGVVSPIDVAQFKQNMTHMQPDEALGTVSKPGSEPPPPLKIMVTHHPLIAYTGHDGKSYQAAQNSNELLSQLRLNRFHLALHGHTHQPHILSDLPLDPSFADSESPLLQIGAGSLGSSMRTFNEIVATRDKATGGWSADTRIVRLDERAKRPYMHFALYPAPPVTVTDPKDAKKDAPAVTALVSTQALDIRVEFERRLSSALENFQAELATGGDLLNPPLKIIQGTIEKVIFKDYQIRMGLALKQRFSTMGNPMLQTGGIVLQNTYIEPGFEVDTQYIHPFRYPETVAAWALILGEPIIYPFKNPHALINSSFLNSSGKMRKLLDLLQQQSNQGDIRASVIANKLANGSMTMQDMYQSSPPSATPSKYTSFIAVPIPLKPEAAMAPQLPEIGTLAVDVVDPDPTKAGEAFTPERQDMLRTLSYTIGIMLMTAHALGRPVGTWHNL